MKMTLQTYYSKPSGDIGKEESLRGPKEAGLLKTQKRANAFLKKQKYRTHCILCNKHLRGEIFKHRDLDVVTCKICGHIQSRNLPPKGYPFIKGTGYTYTSIYPKLTATEYRNRMKRIYKPKLDWALSSLVTAGIKREVLQKKRWVEIGSGAGYFLSALKAFGAKQTLGIDMDEQLVTYTRDVLGKNAAIVSNDSAGVSIQKHNADIYVAFFVFEHIEDLYGLTKILSALPKGTILVFSVPTYGVSSLLEQAFPDRYARSFDMAVHTQVFTDTSIDYFLKHSGFKKISEWLFGQDALEFVRKVQGNKESSVLSTHLGKSVDAIQQALDINRLTDQQHIVAVKV